MARFILIHGAFQGSWIWTATAAALRAAGHDVLTPGLTGLGDRSHLLRPGIGLADYVDDVVNAVCYAQCGPAIFVGHSYAGLVASAAAARLSPLAAGLVYVDALIPGPGRSFLDMAGPEFGKMLAAHTHDEWLVRPWPLPVFGVVEPELAPDYVARLTSTPLAAFTAPYAFDLPTAPKAFIRCTQNPNPLIARQAAKAKAQGMAYAEIASAHSPMITVPEALAAALAGCVRDMPGEGLEVPAGFHARMRLRAAPARAGEVGGPRP